jgi:sugar phosphate isomerase/epimerase
LIHPSGYRDGGANGAYLYTGTNATARKASLVTSLKALVTVCKNAGTELVMENLGNYNSPSNSMTIQPAYINYFMSQAPGAKFCFDFSHGTINLYNTGASYINGLNKGILTALHVHGGGNNRDQHLFPGYSGMYEYSDKLDWGETYEAIINYGYRGPFTYEPASYAVDCNASWSSLIHNYYNYVYPAYRKRMGN